ncbi:MAG: response regulator, partial [Spirochaetota bacterium]
VILDNIMPKLSGWEVTRIIKNHEEYKDIPVIMFSAMDDVKDKVEGFELGVEDYITKPFNFSEVLARIRAVLRSRELARQVLQKERRIALVESLNKSLLYFTEHVKQPVVDLLNNAKKIDPSNAKNIRRFVDLVSRECEAVLATISGLEEEIKELRAENNEEQQSELILQDLDEKFQKHFKNWKERAKNLKEVSG